MPVIGQQLVAKNIIAYGGGFFKYVNKTMTSVKGMLDKEITENISLTDHTLEDLAKLGHPYSRRHGIQGSSVHGHEYYQVHKQSGKLLSSKFSGVNEATFEGGVLEASAFVGLDSAKAKHALHVVYGTSKMIPRPVLQESRSKILPKALDLIKTNLKGFTFSFKGQQNA